MFTSIQYISASEFSGVTSFALAAKLPVILSVSDPSSHNYRHVLQRHFEVFQQKHQWIEGPVLFALDGRLHAAGVSELSFRIVQKHPDVRSSLCIRVLAVKDREELCRYIRWCEMDLQLYRHKLRKIFPSIGAMVADELSKRFPGHVVDCATARRPKACLDYIMRGIDAVHLACCDKPMGAADYLERIDRLNEELGKQDPESLRAAISPLSKNWDRYYQDARRHNFFLGLHGPSDSDPFVYRWIRQIAEQLNIVKSCSPKKQPPAKKKKNISWVLRSSVYRTFMGNVFDGVCVCCRTTHLTPQTFVVGHVVSESCGGDLSLDNLRPICVTCNSSMGTRNMVAFMSEKFPLNLAGVNGASSGHDAVQYVYEKTGYQPPRLLNRAPRRKIKRASRKKKESERRFWKVKLESKRALPIFKKALFPNFSISDIRYQGSELIARIVYRHSKRGVRPTALKTYLQKKMPSLVSIRKTS